MHSAAVEVIAEGSDVRVPEHTTVQVLQWPSTCGLEPLLVWATVLRGQGAGLSGGPGPRAAVLEQQVLDALHGRVVGQVAPTRPPHPPGAHGVGAQGAAVPCSPNPRPTLSSPGDAQVQRRCNKLRVAPQDSAGSSY